MTKLYDIERETKKSTNETTVSTKSEYDPYEHRKVERPTNNLESFVHLIKASMGTGLLAMPNAFLNSGWLVGIIFTIFIGAIAIHCLHVLVKCMYILCQRNKIAYLSYPDALTVALQQGPPKMRFISKFSKYIIDFLLGIYHTGICCVYVVFIAKNVKELVDCYLIELPVRIHIVILFIPLLLIYSIRDLKSLAPFSSVANILIIIGKSLIVALKRWFLSSGPLCLAVILYYVFSALPSFSNMEKSNDIIRFPFFFGTILFALEAVGIVLAVEQNMKTPKDFLGTLGVLNQGMFIIVALYGIFGLFGYWRYGTDIKEVITLNIPQNEILSQVVKAMFILGIFVSYSLQGYIPMDIFWCRYLKKKVLNESKLFLYEYCLRICIVMFTVLAACAIPDIGIFLSLIGALCLTLLGIAFPALIQFCTLYPNRDYGKFNYQIYKCIFLIIFSAFGLFVGTYTSIRDIVIYYS